MWNCTNRHSRARLDLQKEVRAAAQLNHPHIVTAYDANELGERFYLVPRGLLSQDDLPRAWGLLECKGREISIALKPARQSQRTEAGFLWEMNLLLASLRRVEVRIEPQTITDFLKWKNRLLEYNGGRLPEGITSPESEPNVHLTT